ncbi:hypothetical protein Aperf_G00000104438 [Anoplocephala perfoliata]
MSKNNPKKKAKLPITEYVDPEERYCYGITPEDETRTGLKKDNLENPTSTQSGPGIVGKTGQLIGALGSGLISGSAGAVSLGFSAVRAGVSVGTSVVTGALSYIPFPRRGPTTPSTATTTSDPPNSQEDIEDSDDGQSATPLPAKSGGLLSVVPLFRAPAKDKAD